MVSRDLLKRWRFFLDNAGYAVPPGRAVCALALARAEREALADGWSAAWVSDNSPAEGCACGECDGKPPETWEGCVLIDPHGNLEYRYALWGIGDATDDYRRVVRAELFSEMLNELAAAEVAAVLSL